MHPSFLEFFRRASNSHEHQKIMNIEPLFFRALDGARLCGVWRWSTPTPNNCWIICPPFAEEEKSAHRTLVELADSLVAQGDAVLFFAYGGIGDSEGEFSAASLTSWSEDILDACNYSRARYPQSTLGLIGLRLGASLAAQVGEQTSVDNLILIEPILRGRSFLMQLGARKKLRAMMTEEEGGSQKSEVRSQNAKFEDLDGWPLGATLREELKVLDLSSHPPKIKGGVLALQVSSREQISPALEQFARALNEGASTQAVVMPPFWNRLDHLDSTPLIEAVAKFETQKSPQEIHSHALPISEIKDEIFTLENPSSQTLVAIHQRSKIKNQKSKIKNQSPQLLFLHGWTGYRTGPHQMLVGASRHFAEAEYSGLRFDFAGRGDSEGDAKLTTLATMADDAREMIRYLRDENPLAPIVLVGLCSGCEVAFAVADEAGVSGLMLWSAPVFAAGQSSERMARKRSTHLKDYARKMMRPATWAKVLSGRLDVKGVRKVIGQGGGEEHKNIESGEAGHLPKGWREDAMQRFSKVRVPSLLIYGTADPTTEEALAWHRGQLRVEPEIHLVDGANHSYYGLDWESEVFAASEKWLSRHFSFLPEADD